jgi:hypothetical protein
MSGRESKIPPQAAEGKVSDPDSSGQVSVQAAAATSPAMMGRLPKLAYGVGHVFNDLCASMWFSYLVLFFHTVVQLGNTYAGMLILIGQLADALATPIIGFLCDKTHVRYGRRKLWHLIGTVMVAISFFFFWHICLGCSHSALAIQIVYFSIPIIIFQFGWASVQISHLSLIPELTDDKNERVGLNAIRYYNFKKCVSLFRDPAELCTMKVVHCPPALCVSCLLSLISSLCL